MIKSFASIAILLIAFAVIVAGIGAYLGPDGLSHCGDYPSTKQDCTEVDAIVAISGGDTPARTEQAIELYKQGWAPLLVFSGAAADKAGPSNAETMKRQAIAANVPARDIITEETSETTKQNATNSIDMFTEREIKSIVLVTSAYHQRRAGLEFGNRAGAGIKIINHPVGSDNQWSQWWWLSPMGWYLAVGELFKITAFYAGGTK